MVKSAFCRTVKIDDQGRILIPADMRRKLGMSPGSSLTLWVEDGELCARTLEEGVRRAQNIVRRHTKGRKGLVNEFLSERRSQAELE